MERALGIHPSGSYTLNIPGQAMKKKNEKKNAPRMIMTEMTQWRIPTVHMDQCHWRRHQYPTGSSLIWDHIAQYVPPQGTDACATLKSLNGMTQ